MNRAKQPTAGPTNQPFNWYSQKVCMEQRDPKLLPTVRHHTMNGNYLFDMWWDRRGCRMCDFSPMSDGDDENVYKKNEKNISPIHSFVFFSIYSFVYMFSFIRCYFFISIGVLGVLIIHTEKICNAIILNNAVIIMNLFEMKRFRVYWTRICVKYTRSHDNAYEAESVWLSIERQLVIDA